jgi:hypothetical protein
VDNFVPLGSIEVFVCDMVLAEERLTVWVISGHSFECGLADSELSDEKTRALKFLEHPAMITQKIRTTK